MLRIKDWNKHFETAQSRKNTGPLTWVAIPTKHDGEGYRTLIRQENGAALYGAWILIVAVAAKAKARGYLIGDKGPLTAESISLKTDAPSDLIREAMELLTDGIGWIEAVEVESIEALVAKSDGSGSGVDHRTVPDRTDSTGQNQQGSDPGSGDRDGLGEGRQSRPERKINPNSVFLKLTEGMLKDPAALRKWFLWQAGTKSKVFDADGDNWRFCLGCAEVARGKEKPHRYFATIFGGKKDELNEQHRRRAAELAREFPVSNGAAHA